MPREGLDLSPLHLLHRADQCAAMIYRAEVPEVTPRQLAVLLAVADNEPANHTTLAVSLGVHISTVTDLVKRLCREGFCYSKSVDSLMAELMPSFSLPKDGECCARPNLWPSMLIIACLMDCPLAVVSRSWRPWPQSLERWRHRLHPGAVALARADSDHTAPYPASAR
jgi:hypothetical protein